MGMSEDLWPVITVVCAICESEIEVPAGLNAADALWLHEHDCREQILGESFYASWREVA